MNDDTTEAFGKTPKKILSELEEINKRISALTADLGNNSKSLEAKLEKMCDRIPEPPNRPAKTYDDDRNRREFEAPLERLLSQLNLIIKIQAADDGYKVLLNGETVAQAVRDGGFPPPMVQEIDLFKEVIERGRKENENAAWQRILAGARAGTPLFLDIQSIKRTGPSHIQFSIELGGLLLVDYGPNNQIDRGVAGPEVIPCQRGYLIESIAPAAYTKLRLVDGYKWGEARVGEKYL